MKRGETRISRISTNCGKISSGIYENSRCVCSSSRRDGVKIAQRFNAGLGDEPRNVPKERLNLFGSCEFCAASHSIVPSERVAVDDFPTVKTVGYFRMSLRDKFQIGRNQIPVVT